MNFGTALRSWSTFHQPNAKSSDRESKFFTFDYSGCGNVVQAALTERLQDWEMFPRYPFSEQEQDAIQRHYSMGQWSHSPCGGGIHFDRVVCPVCDRQFLFSYGIHEPNNGLLLLTVEGVVEIN